MNIATTGVLLITVDRTLPAPMSLAWAEIKLFGRPNTSCENQAIAPVSRRPAITTYRAAIVMTPGLEKPDRASEGETMPTMDSTIIAPSSTTSVGAGVVASITRTVMTIASVNQISQVMR